MTAELPMLLVRSHPRPPLTASSPCDIAGMKARQRIKIQEIRAALIHSGITTLDEQTKVLGLCRSTAWSILKPNHKSSGLSAQTINSMLKSPRLPIPVRQKIFEYVRERIAGTYGHSERRRGDFAANLSSELFNGPIGEARANQRRQRVLPPAKHVADPEASRRRRRMVPA